MLLAIDIGNSTVKLGVYESDVLRLKFSIPTIRGLSAIEISDAVTPNFDQKITAVIVSSVVPELEASIYEFAQNHLDISPVFVTNDFDFEFSAIDYKPVSSIGTDRLIAAFAAVQKHDKPCIVCDFGTATTIDCVDENRVYLGGVIAPGMRTLAESLHLKTSKLPLVALEKPESVIGNSTKTAMQSGVFYGGIGLVEGILTRMISELGNAPKVVATGGFAKLIAENCGLIGIVEENLILDGLRILHDPRAADC